MRMRLGCDSIQKLQCKLPDLRHQLRRESDFREIYDFAYLFSREKGQKCVQLETAIGMWKLLFAERQWKLVDVWCDFLVKHHNRAISKDTWTQLLDFCKVRPSPTPLQRMAA
jgi:DCN1-like protein 1/2